MVWTLVSISASVLNRTPRHMRSDLLVLLVRAVAQSLPGLIPGPAHGFSPSQWGFRGVDPCFSERSEHPVVVAGPCERDQH
jgi:hypothetical protein